MKRNKESFIENLRKLIYSFGTEQALNAVEIMLTQEIESIKELNECIVDELVEIPYN